MKAVVALCTAALLAVALADSQTPQLTAWLIPHSHCDPGWLDSFEKYYLSQVSTILTSVVTALKREPYRRFVWAETSFFMRWFESQSPETQQDVRNLLGTGQLEFVGGGWVQNDEANPAYESVVAQMTEGHELLLTLFGVKPRIAVQFDPFGHSAQTATIAALAGYSAIVLNRIDHTAKAALKERAAMEFVWRPYAPSAALRCSPLGSRGGEAVDGEATCDHLFVPSTAAPEELQAASNASIFAHVLHSHYSAPRGFDFENSEGVAIHPDYNLAQRADALAGELRSRSGAYRTSQLLVPFGDDFKFQDAERQFSNMDRLVQYFDAHAGDAAAPAAVRNLRLRYGTLSEYFDAVWAEAHSPAAESPVASTEEAAATAAADDAGSAPRHAAGAAEPPPSSSSSSAVAISFPTLEADRLSDGGVDWFPYADNANSWWVGYYTSRPLLKQMVNRAFFSLKAADALMALGRPWASAWQRVAAALADASQAVARDGGGNSSSEDGGAPLSAAEAVRVRVALLAASAAPYAGFSWLGAFQRLEQTRLDAALCLHHDAITGTSRDFVVEDYTKRMTAGVAAAAGALTDVASLLLGGLPRALGALAAQAADTAELPGSDAEALLQQQLPPRLPLSLAPAPLTHAPHVLPVLQTVRLELLAPLAGAGAGAAGGAAAASGWRVADSTAAHPVVLYNPTAWARRFAASVMVDVPGAATGTAVDSGCGLATTATQWPIGIVVDDAGRPLPSQWLATAETGGLAKAAAAAVVGPATAATGAEAGGRIAGRGWRGLVQPVQVLTAGAAKGGRASAMPEALAALASGQRHELWFEAEVPAYGLATVFVTVAWNATVVAGGGAPDATASDGRGGGGGHTGVAAGCLPAPAAAELARVPHLLARAATTAIVAPLVAAPPAADGEEEEEDAPRPLRNVLMRPLSAAEQSADDDAVGEEPAAGGASAAAAAAPGSVVLENACLAVEVDALTGLLLAVTYKHALPEALVSATRRSAAGAALAPRGVRVRVLQEFAHYATWDSGAYLFRPAGAPVSSVPAHTAFPWSPAASADSAAKPGAAAGDVTVTVSTPLLRSAAASTSGGGASSPGGGLVQTVRVVGPQYSQVIRLVDTLGWHHHRGDEEDAASSSGRAGLSVACGDPLVLDSVLDVRPTVRAGGNEEVIMTLDTDLDVTEEEAEPQPPTATRWPSNPRDNIRSGTGAEAGDASLSLVDAAARETTPLRRWWKAREMQCARPPQKAGGSKAAATPTSPTSRSPSSSSSSLAPRGWWTGDGLGLLRRTPAGPDVQEKDIMRHYYPLNTLTMLSGTVAAAATSAAAAAASANGAATPVDPGRATAWLTLLSGQPFGTTTRQTAGPGGRSGARLEVMLHRHLLRDDGRGLATGVIDTTVLTARLALAVGAEVHVSLGDAADDCGRGGDGGGGAASAAARITRRGAAAPPLPLPAAPPRAYSDLVAGAGLGHPDWLWGWATRAAIHRSQPVTMHADLLDTRAAMVLAATLAQQQQEGEEGGSAAEAVLEALSPALAPASAAAPPADASTHLAVLPLRAAEAPLPRSGWTDRFATRFQPLHSDAWWLQGHPGKGSSEAATPRLDAFPADLPALCGELRGRPGSWPLPVGVRQLCHHLERGGGAASPQLAAAALDAAPDGLPPWVHVMTLQVRDAVTDDAVVRLQNLGGPAVTVDVDAVVGHAAAARLRRRVAAAAAAGSGGEQQGGGGVHVFAPTALTSWRPRTLTLNRHEGYAAPSADTAMVLHQLAAEHHDLAAEEEAAAAAAVAKGAGSGGGGGVGERAPHPQHRHAHRLAFPGARLVATSSSSTADGDGSGFGPLRRHGESVLHLLRTAPTEVRRAAAAQLALGGAANVAARFSSQLGLSEAALVGSFVSQNTEEAGVFLSDAALERMREDAERAKAGTAAAAAGGRLLLLRAPTTKRLAEDEDGVGAGAGADAEPDEQEEELEPLAREQGADNDQPTAGEEDAPGIVAKEAAAPAGVRSRKTSAAAARARARSEGSAPADAAASAEDAAAVTSATAADGSHSHELQSHAHLTLPPTAIRSAVVGLVADDGDAAVSPAAAVRALVPAALLTTAAATAETDDAGVGAAAVATMGDAADAADATSRLVDQIRGLMGRDPAARNALISQVQSGRPLSAAQKRALHKLERTSTRVHAQPQPTDLQELLARALLHQQQASAEAGAAPAVPVDSRFGEGDVAGEGDAAGGEPAAQVASWPLPGEEETAAAGVSAEAPPPSSPAAAAVQRNVWHTEDVHDDAALTELLVAAVSRRGGRAAAARLQPPDLAAAAVPTQNGDEEDPAALLGEAVNQQEGGAKNSAAADTEPGAAAVGDDVGDDDATDGDVGGGGGGGVAAVLELSDEAEEGGGSLDPLLVVSLLGVSAAACLFCLCGGCRPRAGIGGGARGGPTALPSGPLSSSAAPGGGGRGVADGSGLGDDAFMVGVGGAQGLVNRAYGWLARSGLLGAAADSRRTIIKQAVGGKVL